MHTVYVVVNLLTGEYFCGKTADIEKTLGIARIRIPWLATTGKIYDGYVVLYAKDCGFK